MGEAESRPLFSRELRARITAHLRDIRIEGLTPDASTISVGVDLILEALLEM